MAYTPMRNLPRGSQAATAYCSSLHLTCKHSKYKCEHIATPFALCSEVWDGDLEETAVLRGCIGVEETEDGVPSLFVGATNKRQVLENEEKIDGGVPFWGLAGTCAKKLLIC
jgi:hypothetical protein